ncbi:MAG: biopolymer transporter ExbD [Bradymonadales bacterium]
MAKVYRVDDAEELNLTPILNIVLVLIPLMLLSVVFLKIAIIDVTMPQRSAGAANQDGEPPKRLQLFISRQGFTVLDGMMAMPPVAGCPESGVTVCVSNPDAQIEVDRHDWVALYNLLIDLKNNPSWTTHETIEIVADPGIPYGMIVKAMDVSRYQLVDRADVDSGAQKGARLADKAALNDAAVVQTDVAREDGTIARAGLTMFPLVVLGLPMSQ